MGGEASRDAKVLHVAWGLVERHLPESASSPLDLIFPLLSWLFLQALCLAWLVCILPISASQRGLLWSSHLKWPPQSLSCWLSYFFIKIGLFRESVDLASLFSALCFVVSLMPSKVHGTWRGLLNISFGEWMNDPLNSPVI